MLGDMERVTTGQPIELRRIDQAFSNNPGDRLLAEHRQRHSADDTPGCDVSHDNAKWVFGAHLVAAIRYDHHAAKRLDSSREKTKRVKCRFIRPMCVLDHQERGLRRIHQRTEHTVKQLMRGGAFRQQTLDVGPKFWRYVKQWAKRAGCRQGVARTDEDP